METTRQCHQPLGQCRDMSRLTHRSPLYSDLSLDTTWQAWDTSNHAGSLLTKPLWDVYHSIIAVRPKNI